MEHGPQERDTGGSSRCLSRFGREVAELRACSLTLCPLLFVPVSGAGACPAMENPSLQRSAHHPSPACAHFSSIPHGAFQQPQ